MQMLAVILKHLAMTKMNTVEDTNRDRHASLLRPPHSRVSNEDSHASTTSGLTAPPCLA